MMPSSYGPDELREIERSVRSGEEVRCPRCDVVMDRRRVPPRSDVSYVRDRVWVTCPTCRGAAVVDRRRP